VAGMSRLIGFLKRNPLIAGGLVAKILVILFTTPPVMAKWFVPFIEFFVSSGFKNPYQEFFSRGELQAFPYSSIMLWMYSAPLALVHWVSPTLIASVPNLLYTLPRLVTLAADGVILYALIRLLPAYKARLLYFWWLNPVVMYISYVHGQLDALPTAALMISLVCLFAGGELAAFLMLGLGIAMKSHLLAALPFMAIYIYFRHFSLVRPILLASSALLLFGVLQLPYWSDGYVHLVLLEKRSLRLFALNFPFDADGKAFLFAPAVVLFLFFKYYSLKTTNRDTLLLTLGLLYAAMVSVVPPTPGWFMWCMPFLVYFFVKYRETSRLSFLSLLCFYVLYQLVDRDSDVPAVFRSWWPDLWDMKTIYQSLLDYGADAQKIENLMFTALEGALLMNILWVYKVGISSSNLARRLKQNFRIGICGDSGSGKSTITEALVALFGKNEILVVAGDDLHKWERGHENWKSQTHLDPKSNRLHDDIDHAERLMAGHNVKRSFYDHKTGKFTAKQPVESRPFIIFQGLHTFFLDRMRQMMHVKIFIDPEKSLRYYWKIKRDMAYRGYTKEQVLAQIEKREPDALKYIETQKSHADMVVRYLPIEERTVDEMLEVREVSVKLQVVMNADLNVECLVGALKASETMAADYWYEPDVGRVVFECQGTLTQDVVKEIAGQLVVAHQELVGAYPDWKAGYDGILQLLMLFYIANFYTERRRV
jgi:uridine kinase